MTGHAARFRVRDPSTRGRACRERPWPNAQSAVCGDRAHHHVYGRPGGRARLRAGDARAGGRQRERARSPSAASIGPNASSRVDATVTRTVNGAAVTLPAAAVPALAPGDVVDVRFPDYTRPPARANYHVNVAFITEAPPLALALRAAAARRTSSSPTTAARQPAAPARLHFVYGAPDHRGIPIFFIVPEDAKTRGDGRRAQLRAARTRPISRTCRKSANDAVARYSWFRDFLAVARARCDRSRLGAAARRGRRRFARAHRQARSRAATRPAHRSPTSRTASRRRCSRCNTRPTSTRRRPRSSSAASPAQRARLSSRSTSSRCSRCGRSSRGSGHQEYEYLPATLQLTAPRPVRASGPNY